MKTSLRRLLIPVLLLTGCSGDEPVLGPDGKPVNSIDLTYVTDDFVGALVIHPARVLKSPLLQQLKDAGAPIDERLAAAKQGPVDPETIDQVMILIDQETTEALSQINPMQIMMGRPPSDLGKLVPTAIVRFNAPVDAIDLLGGDPQVHPVEVDGLKAYSVTVVPEATIYMPDDKTLIFTKKSMLTKIIGTTSADSPLITSLKGIDRNNDVMLVADLSTAGDALRKLADQVNKRGDPDAAKFAEILPKLTGLTLSGGISGYNLLQVTMTTTDEADAKTAGDAFADVVAEAKSKFQDRKQELAGEALSDGFTAEDRDKILAFLDETMTGFTSSTDGTTATLSLKKPDGFENIVAMMKPAIEQARGAAQTAVNKNNLKQIGLAFHNYHDTWHGFPAAGGNVDGTKLGLSWRVHLLPYLEQNALYEQFNLDEPWDSDTNKSLIDQMPDVFKVQGVTEPGKTSIHVFVGEGAAFEGDKGMKLRDFTDGPSNTLLAVQAGPDTADIWTKPGGLPFDPADPKAALGDVGDSFLGLLGDGSVKVFESTLPTETLKALITRNGAEAVSF